MYTGCVAFYLSEKGLVDLHPLVRTLRKHFSAAVPAVAHGRVGVGHAAQEHRPLVVELLFSLSYTLVHRHHGVIQVCWTEADKQIPYVTYTCPGIEVAKSKPAHLNPAITVDSETAQHARRGRCLTGGESCLSR